MRVEVRNGFECLCFKRKTAYEVEVRLRFRRVLFRSIQIKNEGEYHTALVELATLRKDVGFQLRVNNLIPNGYFKFGISKPSYGLKIEDHTTFIRGGNIQLVQGNHREGMPFIPTLENVGLMELGFYFGDTFISVSRTTDGYILGSTETYVGRIYYYRSLRSFQSVSERSCVLEGDIQIFGGREIVV